MAKTGKKARKVGKKKETSTNVKKTKIQSPKKTQTAPSSASKRKRYSQKERESILTRYTGLRKSGKNAYDAAEDIGVSYITIRSWEKKKEKPKTPKLTADKTKVTTMPRQSISAGKLDGLSLVLKDGVRVEGLSVEQVIRILKNL